MNEAEQRRALFRAKRWRRDRDRRVSLSLPLAVSSPMAFIPSSDEQRRGHANDSNLLRRSSSSSPRRCMVQGDGAGFDVWGSIMKRNRYGDVEVKYLLCSREGYTVTKAQRYVPLLETFNGPPPKYRKISGSDTGVSDLSSMPTCGSDSTSELAAYLFMEYGRSEIAKSSRVEKSITSRESYASNESRRVENNLKQ
nr:increased DNA methylation 1-like isoform X2 [Ipomoea trifida]